MKFRDFLFEIKKMKKLPLTDEEKKLIGDTGIFKQEYNLDVTQSYYRLDKRTFSMPFKGEQDLDELKKLIGRIK